MTSFETGEREGPETIPAHTTHVAERRTCHGCRYYTTHINGNVCGGFGGRVGPTVSRCKHPDVMAFYDEAARGQLTLRTPDRGVPRMISADAGYGAPTPAWCPFLAKQAGA